MPLDNASNVHELAPVITIIHTDTKNILKHFDEYFSSVHKQELLRKQTLSNVKDFIKIIFILLKLNVSVFVDIMISVFKIRVLI